MTGSLRNVSQDHPISSGADDVLGRDGLVASLIKALIREVADDRGRIVGRRSTGVVVGLTGAWGLGKSSVLNLLEEELSGKDHVVVARFNPWLFKGRDELLAAFFNALREALGRSAVEEARALQTGLDRYWGAIDLLSTGVGIAADALGGGGLVSVAVKSGKEALKSALRSRPTTAETEKANLEAKIADTNLAVVVLIDELDRVDDEEVRAVAQLVKAIGDIRGLSYLVAYDSKRVATALGFGDLEAGQSYLEKIVQYAVPLRPLFEDDVRHLLNDALTTLDVPLPPRRWDYQAKVIDIIVGAIETPRDVKRLVGTFSILARAVEGEVCPFDVLGYSWLLTKSPGLRDAIAARIDEFVADPAADEMAKRVSRQMEGLEPPSFAEIVNMDVAKHEILLQAMFRYETESSNLSDGLRLHHRRNLVRLLYLGDPPRTVRRSEVLSLWNEHQADTLLESLTSIRQRGAFEDTLDRVADLIMTLDPAGDSTFWLAVSQSFVRDEPLSLATSYSNQVSEASRTLRRMGRSGDEGAARLLKTAKSLREANALSIFPALFRQELFAHGMIEGSSSRGNSALSREYVDQIIAEDLARWRTAILDGTVLKHLPTLDLIYIFLNLDRWDEELKNSLRAQLEDSDSLLTFSGLMLPPGHTIGRDTLHNLLNVELLQPTIDKVLSHPSDRETWLLNSVGKLARIAAGHDPLDD